MFTENHPYGRTSMYVCICNNVTENDIEQAVRSGARSLECLEQALAVSTCCGQCRCFADDVLRQALTAVLPEPAELPLAS